MELPAHGEAGPGWPINRPAAPIRTISRPDKRVPQSTADGGGRAKSAAPDPSTGREKADQNATPNKSFGGEVGRAKSAPSTAPKTARAGPTAEDRIRQGAKDRATREAEQRAWAKVRNLPSWREPRPHYETPWAPKKCWGCGSTEHRRNQCPKPGHRDRYCSGCGRRGVNKEECGCCPTHATSWDKAGQEAARMDREQEPRW